MVQDNNRSSNSRNRGRRNFRFRNRNNNKSVGGGGATSAAKGSKPRELKFYLHDSEARKYSESYDKIRKHIILKIQENFQHSLDVTESLEDGKKKAFTVPKKKKSTNADAELKKIEDHDNHCLWLEDYKWYQKDIRRFDEEWARAYALIWKGFCSKEVQVALEEMSDFRTKIRNDPLELLQRIETLMHVPQRAKYPPLTLVEVLARYVKIRQGDNESLIDYLSRFKSETEW